MGISKNRVFDTEQLQTLINKTQTLMETADTVTEELYSELCRLSDTLGKLPPDLQDSGFKERVDTLKQSIKTEDFKNYYTIMTKSLKRLKETIPKEDQKLGKKVDIIAASVEIVTNRLKKLKDLIPEGIDTGSYADFEKAYTRCTSNWGSTAKALNNLLDKINASLKGGKNEAVCFSEDPVNLSTGNFIYEKTDLKLEGMPKLALTRFYNELDKREGAFGRGWRHPYEVCLLIEEADYTVLLEDGKEEQFQKKKDGTFFGEATCSRLQAEETGYTYRTKEGIRYHFNEAGQYTAWEDRAGSRFLLTYQEERLTKVLRETDGAYFTFLYNEAGQLTAVSDAQGRTAFYRYDPEGRLAQTANAAGEAYSYTYDEAGRIRSVENPQGTTTVENQYDSKGRTIHQTFPDGGSMSYQYDDEARQVTLTERNESRITYCHNERYQNIRTIYEDGEEKFAYNRKGQRILYRDCNGNTTRYAYDSRGNLTQVIDALGVKSNATYDENNQLLKFSVNGTQQLKNTYDSQGNLIESKDALGRTTAFTYQEKGRPETITQPDGGIVCLSYDEKGNITGITDPNGNQNTYQYDNFNRVEKVIDGRGGESFFEYDSLSQMTKMTNPLGQKIEYRYNSNGKRTEMQRPDGNIIRTEYNELSRPSVMVDALGNEKQIVYDCMWNISEVNLPNGASKKYEYNKRNRLTKLTDANGNKIEYQYDANGNRILEIRPDGVEVRYTYDGKNRLTSVTDGEGNLTQYSYNSMGLLVQVIDAAGNKSYIEYDEAGQKICETDPMGNATSYTYTTLGMVETVTDRRGRRIYYKYEKGGRLHSVELWDGKKEIYTYDESGNMIGKTDRKGNNISWEYDLLNRVIKKSNSFGNAETYDYDIMGNLISVVDINGGKTQYEYDVNGNLISVIDPIGNKMEYKYDVMNQLVEVKKYGEEKSCYITKYNRNNLGQVEKIINPLGYEENYVYDARGHILEKQDREGYQTAYTYNKQGKVSRVCYEDGREAEFSYNPLGQLVQIKDWIGETKVKSDLLGRIEKVKYPDGKEVSYTWGENGKKESITYPDGEKVYYKYNEFLELSQLQTQDATIDYQYNEWGELEEKRFSNGCRTNYQYDALGRIQELTHYGNEGILEHYLYGYDSAGNKSNIIRQRKDIEEESGTYQYAYDAFGRLSEVIKDSQPLRTYKYDAFGNRIEKWDNTKGTSNYTYNAVNQLITEQEEGLQRDYQYDRRGNLREIWENGQLEKSYLYGSVNRLEEAVNQKGKKAQYKYNGIGNRVGKQIYEMDDLVPEKQVSYYTDLTRQYNNLLVKEEGEQKQAYIWDENTALMSENGKLFCYFQDELGSTIRFQDQTGEIQESYVYDEFGNSEHKHQNGLQPFGYTGYQNDEVSESYFAQAREYFSEIGRFGGEDQIPGSLNMPFTMNSYSYCYNSPMNLVDLDGKLPTVSQIKKALSDVIRRFKESVWNKCGVDTVLYEEDMGDMTYQIMGHMGGEFFIIEKGTEGKITSWSINIELNMPIEGYTNKATISGNASNPLEWTTEGRLVYTDPNTEQYKELGKYSDKEGVGMVLEVGGPIKDIPVPLPDGTQLEDYGELFSSLTKEEHMADWSQVAEMALGVVAIAAIAVIVIDNIIGAGVVDDFLLAPLGGYVGKVFSKLTPLINRLMQEMNGYGKSSPQPCIQ